jgi:uncharacterized protein (TIGR03067 family)
MKSDLERLQGDWNIAALEMEGRNSPSMGAKILVKGDRFVSIGMGATYEGRLHVDTGRNPKQIDLIFESGPEKGNTAYGIYHIEDDDTWKICFTTHGTNRPQMFSTRPGTGHAYEILKREGSAGAQAEPQAAAGAAVEVPAGNPEHLAPLQGEWSLVSGTVDGQPFDKSMLKVGKRITRSNETTVAFAGQVYMKAKFSVDPTSSPKTIDYVVIEGANKSQTVHGIYETDGKTLTVISAPPGKPRPKEFSSKPGDGTTLTTWKQVKP